MNAIRRKAMQAADDVMLAGAHAGKFFGLLSSGRGQVGERQDAAGLVARFLDLPDEAWPGFEVPLPTGAVFSHAGSALLTRMAMWRTPRPATDVVRELKQRDPELGFVEKSAGLYEANLPGGATMRIAGPKPPITIVAVSQTRHPEEIRDVIRNRLESWGAG